MDYVAFDVETTGTNASLDVIIEVGAVRFVDNKPEGRYSTLVDPKCLIPYGASQVNGITDDMVSGQPLMEEVLAPFAAFCGDLHLVAHNARFDAKFIQTAVEKHQGEAPKGMVLDTLTLARKVFPGMPNYKLGTLVRQFDITSAGFHRAEVDAVYCGEIFARILEALERVGESVETDNLLTLSGLKEIRFPQYTSPAAEQLGLF